MITSYEEMNVNCYLELRQVAEMEGEPIDKQVAEIAILTGQDEISIMNLKLDKYRELSANLSFLTKPYPRRKVQKSYDVGKYELVLNKDVSDITTKQFIDFQTFGHDAEKNMVKMLSIVLIPKGHTYDNGYDIADVQEEIGEHLCIIDANEIYAFFLSKLKKLIYPILTYSEKMIRRMKKGEEKDRLKAQMKEARQMLDIIRNGDGLIW